MSEQVERRLLEVLGNPTESPYGNPIPALEELGGPAARPFLEGVVNIVERVRGTSEPVAVSIRRLGEPVQFEPELLEQLRAAGVVPGADATISSASGYVLVQVDGFGEGLELPPEVAVHVYVAA